MYSEIIHFAWRNIFAMHTMQQHQNRNMSFNFFEYPFFYGHLRHSSKTHLRRFCADSASLILSISVANVRISEQKAKLIMDYFEWECFEWAQIWKIVLSIWKIFHKIRAFLDKNPIIALSDPKNPPRAACPMEPRKGVPSPLTAPLSGICP